MCSKERFKLIPEVYLILLKDRDVLLLRRFQTGYEDGNYSLVAGHADGKETFTSAVARESLEEAGIILKDNLFKNVMIMHRICEDRESVGLYFVVKDWLGEIKNMEPEKCDDLRFFPVTNLPENTIPYIRFAIESCLKGETYCEFGWEK